MKVTARWYVFGLGLLVQGLAWGHGKMVMEEDTCARSLGGSLVHYSAYQPEQDAKGQYCSEIPRSGVSTFFVVDLVDKSLRDRLIGLKIVGPDESGSERPLIETPPQVHPLGIIETEVKLDRPGHYRISLSSPGEADNLAPMDVYVDATNWGKVIKQATFYVGVASLLGFIAYRVRRWVMLRKASKRGA